MIRLLIKLCLETVYFYAVSVKLILFFFLNIATVLVVFISLSDPFGLVTSLIAGTAALRRPRQGELLDDRPQL